MSIKAKALLNAVYNMDSTDEIVSMSSERAAFWFAVSLIAGE